MGKIENKIRITKNKKLLLDVLLAIGGLSVALMTPNMLWAFKKLGLDKKFGAKQKYSFFRTIKNLEKSDFVKKCIKNGKEFYILTEKGKLFADSNIVLKNKKWDKKWRMVIFDIPEKIRDLRNKVRNSMRAWGFYLLQDSVWIFPYPCEEYLTLLKVDLSIGKEILYVVADAIEADQKARKFFGLPLSQ